MTESYNDRDEATRLVRPPSTPPTAPETVPTRTEDGTLPPGTLVSHTYRILELVARGGMGEVYRAVHEVQQTEHAVKTILPELASDPRMVELFRREAMAVREIRNDAVVSYDGIIRDEHGRLFIVTDFVHGPSLADLIAERPLTLAEIGTLCRRVAGGLAAAHAKGIVHRDIAPDNVVLADGRVDRATLIDFGIARNVAGQAHTVIGGDFAGKYAYASPEQLGLYGGEVDARSDIYSLALVLAAAAAGRPLEMGRTHVAVLEARRTVPDLGDLPEPLRPLLEWMLQPDPADRPQSMDELLRSDLLEALDASETRPQPTAAEARVGAPGSPAGRSGQPAGRRGGAGKRGWALSIGVSVLLAIVAGGGYLLLPDWLETPVPPPEPPGAPLASPQVPPPPLPEERPLPPPPSPEPIDPVQALRERAAGLPCASVTVRDGPSGPRLSGFVSRQRDLAALREFASGLPHVADVEMSELAVREPPFCRVLLALAPFRPADRSEDGLAVELDDLDGEYHRGQDLIIDVAAPTGRPGHLTVDFIDPAGDVSHLMPSPLYPQSEVGAGATVSLGRTADGRHLFTIGPPFGQQMILAVWTAEPLFDRREILGGTVDGYLHLLVRRLESIAAERPDDVRVAVRFLTAKE